MCVCSRKSNDYVQEVTFVLFWTHSGGKERNRAAKLVSIYLGECYANGLKIQLDVMPWFILFLLLLAVMEAFPREATCSHLPDIYWNSTNPMWVTYSHFFSCFLSCFSLFFFSFCQHLRTKTLQKRHSNNTPIMGALYLARVFAHPMTFVTVDTDLAWFCFLLNFFFKFFYSSFVFFVISQ